MLAPWSWTSSLQNWEKINVSCLSHPCGLLWGQPEQMWTGSHRTRGRWWREGWGPGHFTESGALSIFPTTLSPFLRRPVRQYGSSRFPSPPKFFIWYPLLVRGHWAEVRACSPPPARCVRPVLTPALWGPLPSMPARVDRGNEPS